LYQLHCKLKLHCKLQGFFNCDEKKNALTFLPLLASISKANSECKAPLRGNATAVKGTKEGGSFLALSIGHVGKPLAYMRQQNPIET
jgi:hypothetical protein